MVHAVPPPPFAVGDRIRLLEMPHDPLPIPVGATGTVESLSFKQLGARAFWQVVVAWDNGRGLMLSIPPDMAEKV